MPAVGDGPGYVSDVLAVAMCLPAAVIIAIAKELVTLLHDHQVTRVTPYAWGLVRPETHAAAEHDLSQNPPPQHLSQHSGPATHLAARHMHQSIPMLWVRAMLSRRPTITNIRQGILSFTCCTDRQCGPYVGLALARVPLSR